MKKMMLIPALVVMVTVAAFAKKPVSPVKVLSTNMDVVYFKVSCAMIGSDIQVYDENGTLIYTAKVTDHKVIVDFYAEPSGNYTIHVVKDGQDEVINYNKMTVSQSELAAHNFITVTQM